MKIKLNNINNNNNTKEKKSGEYSNYGIIMAVADKFF